MNANKKIYKISKKNAQRLNGNGSYCLIWLKI